jgi:hypothetical protein
VETYGYEWEPAELAFRESKQVEMAVPPGWIERDEERQLIDDTNQWIENWTSSAACLLEGDLKRLIEASQEQLAVLSNLLKEAGLEVPGADLPEPLPLFAWEPAARGGVMALLDVAVDIGDDELVQGRWAKEARASLRSDRFEWVTGIATDDHEIVLRDAEKAILDSSPSNFQAELLYRDRHVWLTWMGEAIGVKHLRH